MSTITMIHGDCIAFMAACEDNAFELAIVDPPYGIGKRLSQGAGKLKNSALQNMNSSWDVAPNKQYFNELERISKNRIIWGGNYFDLPPTRCVLCWDKKQFMPTFSRWEMAWTSFDEPTKLFENTGKETRIHPTQKPVALYKWLLDNYAKPGDRIIDTHGGSGSSVIACIDKGFDMVWIEKDADYYAAAVLRVERFNSQQDLFRGQAEIEKTSTKTQNSPCKPLTAV